MRHRNNGALLALALTAIAGSASAQFGGGTLAITQVGDGSGALTSAAWAAFLDDYSTSGAFIGSTAMRTSASGSQFASTNSGTATSELQLNLTGNGSSLTLGGYNLAAGTTGAAASTVSRTIDIVSLSGSVDSTTGISSFFSGTNIRSVWSADGSSSYAAGPKGLVYDTLGGTTGVQLMSTSNIRQIEGFGGNLYYSTASGGTGIYEITGMPATGTVTSTEILATATSSPYDFMFANGGNTLYVADDGAGISKYVNTGGTWSLSYTGLTTGFTGVRSITTDGTNIYGIAVTSSGLDELISTSDTGSGFGAFNLLATPGTNENFRGVRYIPVAAPEPISMAFLSLGIVGLVAQRRTRK